MMDKWSEQFNALPKSVRLVACAVGHQQRIRDLERDKKRWKASYDRQVAEANDLIKRLQKTIDVELEESYAVAQAIERAADAEGR